MESSTKFILHERLVQLRTERGWSQYDLEEKLYLTQKAISNMEKGNCTLSNLIQLADLYDVSLDYLIGRSSERKYNTLGMDALVFDIIEQVNRFSTTEKEILLQHLKLANELKSGIAT